MQNCKMGKHSKYARHYKTDWQEISWAKGWLREHKTIPSYNENDGNEAYCLYCHVSLRAHLTDLKKHTTTKVHVKNAQTRIIKKKETVKHYFKPTLITKTQKLRDLKLAMFVTLHTSIGAVDHLGELLKAIDNEAGEGSFSTLKLHHTKCGCLIRQVIAPSILQDIIRDVGQSRYSIILDESTDVAVNKYLALCIRYFTGSEILTDFLGLIEVERATAEELYKSVVNFFNQISLPLRNMIALGTDGGANLCGKNKSLYTLLRRDVPDLILMKCTCHSIHLAVSKASTELPSCLDFLAHEVYNWFSNSPLRRIQYRKIYDLININEQKSFTAFIQLSATRWLSRYNVIKRLLEHWLELKTFFSSMGKVEKCYKARMIYDILKDPQIYVYCQLLLPILENTNNLNLKFQNQDCDIGSAYSQLSAMIQSLAKRLIKPTFLSYRSETNLKIIFKKICDAVNNDLSYLSPEDADLGYNCDHLMTQNDIATTEKKEIKSRFFNFLIKLLKELVERMPSNLEVYNNIRLLNPVCFLNPQSVVNFESLPILQFILPCEDRYAIENEWRKISFVNWKEEFASNDVPNNVLKFWPVAFNYVDGSGQHVFKNLGTVVLRMLTLPMSNASVERVFSVMNNVKTKLRNKMKLKTLEAILITRIYLYSRNKCCVNFEPTEAMLSLFNSNMYNEKEDPDIDTIEVAMELLE